MNNQRLAALLSAVISQLLALLLLIFQPSADSFPSPHRHFHDTLLHLLSHFIFTTDVAAFLSFRSLSRKRKMDAEDYAFGRSDAVIPRNPDSFKQLFGMKISTFEWLCGLLEPLLDCRDPVESHLNLPAEVRLGIGLFRLSTGSDYPEIALRFRVSEPTSKFCVKHLCRVLCTNFKFWVRFPSQTELISVSSQFKTLTGLPNCCGIVSCSRFDIEGAQPDSIAAQFVVDSSSRILSIIAGFRGNKSDSQVLKSSSLFKDIENGVILNSRPLNVNGVHIPQYLLGNGEYPLLSFLSVPFTDPEPGSVEQNFNRVCGTMCSSSLKAMLSLRKWSVLSRTIKDERKAAVALVGSCSILHNMLISREDYSSFCDDLLGDDRFDFRHRCNLGKNVTEEEELVVRRVLATKARI